jgi:hypothetical protein
MDRRVTDSTANSQEAIASKTIVEGVGLLATQYNEQFERMSARIDQLESRQHDLEVGIDKLIRQLVDAGIEPCWKPSRLPHTIRV